MAEESLVDRDNEKESAKKKKKKVQNFNHFFLIINEKFKIFLKIYIYTSGGVERSLAMQNGALDPIMLLQQRIISPIRRRLGHDTHRGRFALPEMLANDANPGRNISRRPVLRQRHGRRRRRRRRQRPDEEVRVAVVHLLSVVALRNLDVERLDELQVFRYDVLREPLCFGVSCPCCSSRAGFSGELRRFFGAEFRCRFLCFPRRSRGFRFLEREGSECGGGFEENDRRLGLGNGLEREDFPFGNRIGRRK